MKKLRSILVPTDFSPDSLVALFTAVDLASSLRDPPEIVLLHVWQDAEERLTDMTLRTDHEGTAARLLEEARVHGLSLEHAAEFLAALERQGFAVEARMVRGAVAETIVRIAEEDGFDLVVMGTHGRGRLAGAVMGRIAERVVRESTVPVLTARMTESADTPRMRSFFRKRGAATLV